MVPTTKRNCGKLRIRMVLQQTSKRNPRLDTTTMQENNKESKNGKKILFLYDYIHSLLTYWIQYRTKSILTFLIVFLHFKNIKSELSFASLPNHHFCSKAPTILFVGSQTVCLHRFFITNFALIFLMSNFIYSSQLTNWSLNDFLLITSRQNHIECC